MRDARRRIAESARPFNSCQALAKETGRQDASLSRGCESLVRLRMISISGAQHFEIPS